MGGSVGLTIRESNGTEHRMCRWTNILPWAITNRELFRENPKHIKEILKMWYEMCQDWEAHKDQYDPSSKDYPFQFNMTSVYAPYPFLAPIEYGLVVVDMVHKVVLSRQDYHRIGTIASYSFIADANDPQGDLARYNAFFRDGKILKITRKCLGKGEPETTVPLEQQAMLALLKSQSPDQRQHFRITVDPSPFTIETPDNYRDMKRRIQELGFILTEQEEAIWERQINEEEEH